MNTPDEWRVTRHASGLLKVETRDKVIFDGFSGEEQNAYTAAAAPQMRQALALCIHRLMELGEDKQGHLLAASRDALSRSFYPSQDIPYEYRVTLNQWREDGKEVKTP